MAINYYKYHLPFAELFQTNKTTFEKREGILIEYNTEEFQCYGEAAPLPGYSTETLDDVQQVLRNFKNKIELNLSEKNPVEWLQEFYKETDIPASLQFGFDAIACQVQAYRLNKSLREYLFPVAPNKIPVNAIASLKSENYIEDIEKQISKGFQTIKFKIGLDFELEFNRLQEVRTQFTDLTIRVDANQAWSTDEAPSKCQQLESLDIQYCEEPLKNPTPQNYDSLSSNTQLPLALDESIYQTSYWPNILPYTSYLIIKPMLLGSFIKIYETKKFADTHNNKVVFTTSLESGIGRGLTAIIASGKGSPHTAHGLTTGKLLAKDIYSDSSYIANGFYHLDKLLSRPSEVSDHLQEISSKIF